MSLKLVLLILNVFDIALNTSALWSHLGAGATFGLLLLLAPLGHLAVGLLRRSSPRPHAFPGLIRSASLGLLSLPLSPPLSFVLALLSALMVVFVLLWQDGPRMRRSLGALLARTKRVFSRPAMSV